MKNLIITIAFSLLTTLGYAQNWTILNCPSPGGQLGDIDRTNNNIYATRLTGGFFKSIDAGVTWVDITTNYPTGQTKIFKCLNSGNILLHMFTGSTFPWFKSIDQGVTWTAITGSLPINNSLYESPNGTLYAVPSFDGFSTFKTSTDEGTTWTAQSAVIKSIAFTTNGDAYALRWDSGSGEVKLAKSTDNGQTWTNLSVTGLPINAEQLVISPNGNMYVPGSPTLKSANNGSTFVSIGDSSDEVFVDYNNNVFIKKAPSTFSVSADGGTTWKKATTGLLYPSGTVRSVWAHPNGNTYSSNYNPGTASWGIYKYGASTTAVNETIFSNEIRSYPNPSIGKFTFTISNFNQTKIYHIDINNSIGEKIYSSIINSDEVEIDLNKISTGIYFINLTDGANVYSRKIVIQ